MYQIQSIKEQIAEMKLRHPENIYDGIYYSSIEIKEILDKLESNGFYPLLTRGDRKLYIPENIIDAWWHETQKKWLREILSDPQAKYWTTGEYMTAGLANRRNIFYSPQKNMLMVGDL